MSVLFKGGTIINASGRYLADVFAEGNKIKAIGTNLDNGADEVVDAKGKYILPGAIDPHTHISMPFMGTHAQDDYETGTIAAACGGITCVVDFDLQQKGETLLEALERKKALAQGKVCVDYSLHPAVMDPRPDVIDEVKKACLEYGTPSFKIFMVYDFRVDDATMIKLLEVTKKYGGLVQVHAENVYIIQHMNEVLEKEGKLEPYYHAVSRPNIAEEEAVGRAAKMVELTGSRIYIVHLSSKEGLWKVKEARDHGVKVYAETCPHYLVFTDEELKRRGSLAKMSPPLRQQADVDALWQAVEDGAIDVIGSDAAGHTVASNEPLFDDIFAAPHGIPGLDTLFNLSYEIGVNAGRITLPHLVKMTCENPAKIFGLYPRKGVLEKGADADVVIFDPAIAHTIPDKNPHTHVDYSLYAGHRCLGAPVVVIQRGQVVMENGEIKAEPGQGRYLAGQLT